MGLGDVLSDLTLEVIVVLPSEVLVRVGAGVAAIKATHWSNLLCGAPGRRARDVAPVADPTQEESRRTCHWYSDGR